MHALFSSRLHRGHRGRVPTGRKSAENIYLRSETGGTRSSAVARMGNMSMNPPQILIFKIGCDVKRVTLLKNALIFSCKQYFSGTFFLFIWFCVSYLQKLCEPIMLNHFLLCEEEFSEEHGSQSPEKDLFFSLFEASKMSKGHFIRWYVSEVPWKLPQIFVPDKHRSTEVLPASK